MHHNIAKTPKIFRLSTINCSNQHAVKAMEDKKNGRWDDVYFHQPVKYFLGRNANVTSLHRIARERRRQHYFKIVVAILKNLVEKG